jgi:hypothetical protein
MNTLTDQAIEKKFVALMEEGQQFLPGQTSTSPDHPVRYQQWKTQVINLIERVCGHDSAHYKAAQAGASQGRQQQYYILGSLKAAHADYSDGFLTEIRYLVRADLLDDFLTQAEALHHNGYLVPAASLAGAVLEDTLRKLCDKHSVTYDPAKTNIEALNMELARQTVYDKLVQKEVTAKGHLRNEADHGRFANVKEGDVADMLRWVRRFTQEHLK